MLNNERKMSYNYSLTFVSMYLLLLTVNNQFDAATADGSLPSLTSCSDLQSYNGACSASQCNDDYAEWNCDGSGPTCTPYHFKPRGDPNPECSYMDSGDWDMPAFQYNGDKSQYQVWCAKSSKDDPCPGDKVWLTHLCDGAGVQAADCGGDNGYFEEIVIEPEAGVDPSCDGDEYGVTHTDCPTFDHPGMSTTYGKYKAGWWRGFKESQNAGLGYQDNQFLAAAMGNDGDYSSSMNKLAQRDGWYDNNPWKDTNADAYFIGNLYPWRCTKGDDRKNIPFTGNQNLSCYADNEPATGRQQDKNKGDQDIPFYSTYALCAVYSSQTDDMQMRCNFNSYDRDGTLENTDNVLMFPVDDNASGMDSEIDVSNPAASINTEDSQEAAASGMDGKDSEDGSSAADESSSTESSVADVTGSSSSAAYVSYSMTTAAAATAAIITGI